MVYTNSKTHVDKKENGEPADRLKVSGVEGITDGGEAKKKQNPRGCPNGSFVEYRNINSFNRFAEVHRSRFSL